MLFNIEQIINNATHYIHIMKEYIRDITIIVSNTFTNISVKSRLYSLMKWAAFAGLAKKNNNSNNNNSNNKIMQSTMESLTVLHLRSYISVTNIWNNDMLLESTLARK